MEKIVIENMHDADAYQENWVEFATKMAEELNYELFRSTYGRAPSYSASLIFEKTTHGDLTRRKEIHFAKSVLGNFYQVYGLDSTEIADKDVACKFPKSYYTINRLICSPYQEYKTAFELVAAKMQEKYPKDRIVPLVIGQTIIKGLQVRYVDDLECTVNMALFNHFLSPQNMKTSHVLGDSRYGNEMYAVEGSEETNAF